MTDANLAAFQKYLDTARRHLDRFAKLYKEVIYRYWYSEPPALVPEEVWSCIDDLPGGHAWEKVDFAPDRTARLCWEGTLAADKFMLLCKQCCSILWVHKKVLAHVAELRTVIEMPPGHHPWMRLIHRIAAVSPVWSGSLSKWLVVSQRPFDETRKQRFIGYKQGPNDIEPDELEQHLVRELREQGKVVPDVWVEQIKYPLSVTTFHRQMLDELEELVQVSYPDQEELHVRSAPQQSTQSRMADIGGGKAEIPCLITLSQVAPLINRSKRTLENYTLPPPTVPGGNGKAHRWDWRELRPWLESTFGIPLPEVLPDRKPPRSS